jgi:hypothetical protein
MIHMTGGTHDDMLHEQQSNKVPVFSQQQKQSHVREKK